MKPLLWRSQPVWYGKKTKWKALIEKQEIKLLLFAEHMILCVKYLKASTDTPFEWLSTFSEVTKYKVNTQNSSAFLDAGAVVAPQETRWTTHPMKNWVQMSILMNTHTHTLQENVRRFTTHRTRLSGKAGRVWKWLVRAGKVDSPGFYGVWE